MKKRQFTLLELMVVIAIIAILLSMLFPNFKKAKKNAEMVVCQSNMTQLYKSHLFFATDNKRKYTNTYNASTGARWASLIWEYNSNIKLLFCPSETRSGWRPGEDGLKVNPNKSSNQKVLVNSGNNDDVGIGYNAYFGGCGMGLSPNATKPTYSYAMIKEGKYVPMLADALYYRLETPGDGIFPWYDPYARHNRRANFTFIDGHIGTIYKAEAQGLKWKPN